MKELKNFPGYGVTIGGDIVHIATNNPVATYVYTANGKQYKRATLFKGDEFNRVSHTVYVHRLVAAEWLNKPENANIIRFKDGNTLNCKATNLQYISQKELQTGIARGGHTHSRETKRRISEAKKGEKHPKFAGYYVCKFHKYASAREAARKLKTTAKTVINRCKGGKMRGEGWYFLPK